MKTLLALLLAIPVVCSAQTNIKPTPPPQITVTQKGTPQRVTYPATAHPQAAWDSTTNRVTVSDDGVNPITFPGHNDVTLSFTGAWPKCAILAPHVTRDVLCPPGFDGHWTQTEIFQPAPYPVCWAELQPPRWTPDRPPEDACHPSSGYVWQQARPGSTFPMQARPPKGGSYVNPYGVTVTRVTDHTTDLLPYLPAWLREDYNRRQSCNADCSLLAVYQPNGFWNVFSTQTNAFVKQLHGPAGDSEFQWDPNDPNAAYFLPINGGRVLSRLDVAANVASVQYDFTNDVRAIFPNATRYWSKSEGSPTMDGRYWGLMAEADNFTAVYGFVKLDIVSRAVVWSMPNPNGTTVPDNVSLTPSGRWFVVSGLAPVGTKAYATDGSGRVRVLHNGVEHADLGTLSNGHDFYASENYQANGGPVFAIDIDTGAALPLNFNIYGNPDLDNVQPHPCANCAVHISAKAFRAPGWIIMGFFGTPPSNLFLANVETGAVYPLTVIYNNDGDYFDEPQYFATRDLTKIFGNENWGTAGAVDVVRVDVPPLPNSAEQLRAVGRKILRAAVAAPSALPANLHRKKPSLIGK